MGTSKIAFALWLVLAPAYSWAESRTCADIFLPDVQYMGRTHLAQRWETFAGLPDTMVLRPTPEVARIETARAYVLLLHGVGAYYSNPLSMLSPLQLYTQTYRTEDGQPGFAMKRVLEQAPFNAGEIYAEAPALPGSIHGPDYRDFGDLRQMIDPLVDRLRQVRAQLPAGAKIVLQGRSFGASLAAEIGHRYPELVDRLVLVSPSLPERASFDYSVERIRLFDNHSKTNFAWVAWCGELLDQMTWHRPERPFHHVPTYILGGELDNERTPREHELFAHWSTSTTNIKYVLFDKQGHDVTGVNGNNKSEKRRGAQAFASVLQFIGLR